MEGMTHESPDLFNVIVFGADVRNLFLLLAGKSEGWERKSRSYTDFYDGVFCIHHSGHLQRRVFMNPVLIGIDFLFLLLAISVVLVFSVFNFFTGEYE